MKTIKQFKLRMKSVWNILTKRNFILIYGIKEFTREDGEPGRSLAWTRRTDYNTESDFYSMKAAMCSQFGMQIMDEDAKIGNYLPKGCEWDYTITEEALRDAGWKFVEKSPFTGKPEWVHSEYIDPELQIPCHKFYLTVSDNLKGTWSICYNTYSMYKRTVTDMKEIIEFVKFFNR